MTASKVMVYTADCGRGTGTEKVACVLLTSPNDILEKTNNPVLDVLESSGLSTAIGLYFYRFATPYKPFIKIGECTRPDGISKRFKNGWHGSKSLTDSYWAKRKNKVFGESDFLKEVNKISTTNPAYFVFYQHSTIQSHPKIDEIYAYRLHLRLFRSGTLSPEKMNRNFMLGRKLTWHKKSFGNVARLEFPCGTKYPGIIG